MTTDRHQLTLQSCDPDFLDDALSNVTFVVVDLETTGGSADRDAITEIGAVKVRGGEVLGELATLVDPGRTIPPQIVRLTGITQLMVEQAPQIGQVLPAFLEFARGSILVAHNARFDMAFLRAAAHDLGFAWNFPPPLCTVTLARRVLSRDEAPTVKLGALAAHFQVTTQPTHRALDDARATVEVMHRLFERIGNVGVHSYRDLRDYLPRVTATQRAKRTLADGLPEKPGVYLFTGPSNEVLYVGTSTNLYRRVRSYFTSAQSRPRITEMVRLATAVSHVECAHRLEAGVRELRLLAAHQPPYNRTSKYPYRGWWICLTDEPFPRLKVSRTPADVSVGPIRTRTQAADIADLIADGVGLRTCTRTIRGSHDCSTSVRVGGCRGATSDPETREQYAIRVHRCRDLLHGTDTAVLDALSSRLDDLAARELFENAARLRDRLTALTHALARCQRLAGLARLSELVAARPDGLGGWELAVIRHGRLAAAGVAVRGVPPMPVVTVLVASAETVLSEPGPLRGAPAQECSLLYAWLTDGGTRIVCASSGFSAPARGAHLHADRFGNWQTTPDAAGIGLTA